MQNKVCPETKAANQQKSKEQGLFSSLLFLLSTSMVPHRDYSLSAGVLLRTRWQASRQLVIRSAS